MSSENKSQEKTTLHSRNKNRERYDLTSLIVAVPELGNYVKPNKFGDDSVDFANPVAVKLLNKALLKHYYGIANWEFPDENLSPPIPGRADYIHYMADLLKESNFGRLPAGEKIHCLDIGVGASCIYPILGVVEYGWNFKAVDIDKKSVESAKAIVDKNPELSGKVKCWLQNNPRHFFEDVIVTDEKFDLTFCNPPFHASADDARSGTERKNKNLSGKKGATELNFSGVSNELITEGGESKFINDMVFESRRFGKSCFWFSTLVSKQSNLKGIYKTLEKVGAEQIKTINMGTGNKSTRIVAWSFLSREEQKAWKESRFK
ncbi:23S rRNA (adenine(1618)-N(6))-methyltransferase RlmF [Flavobacterium sp. AG291]|uniref:23S rRNA (adenine(1618)-N(6))-methyltransferase RlmF n=1 Tax=Flavobacterium sp. AG291 TaxID=2184000 RepID=UPI000E0B3D8B|nr:23S rRNA (adenine(1618)-N(6))-methyltransferase RlmF [Flavobacterium sp. AG291]RDI06706.1 23S rRNA m(6)A-1618 methyltransferase [Flavobacterium sp. AG291]